jgi:dienelactone hydrolase
MAEVVLYHHVQGLTDGVLAFAEELRTAGHTVHTPDLFEGARPETIEDGMKLAGEIGDDAILEQSNAALAGLPDGLVFAGFSFGAGEAQRLAQTRPGARGALLYEACMPITGEWAFGPWPAGLPVQIHGMEQDPFFGHGGDLDAARELVDTVGPRCPNCSSIRVTDTCSPIARSRRTTRTRPGWCWSARGSSSTG